MIKTKKIFSKKLPYYIAMYAQRKINNYLQSIAKEQSKAKEYEWKSKFENGDSIIFKLSENIQIKLYKDSILSRLIYDGFEVDEIKFLSAFLNTGDIFIDAGANIGLFSIVASNIVGPDGKVVSFEPTPTTFKRLVENIELNNLLNIDARNIGLSDIPAKLCLNLSESGYDAWNTFTKSQDSKFTKSVDVDVSTIDTELLLLDKRKITLVKIDVEGWEKFVLNGGKEFFREYSPVVMLEFTESNAFEAGYFVQENYDILANLGYQWYRFLDGELIEETKKLHYPYDNLIATKNIVELRSRLSCTRTFTNL